MSSNQTWTSQLYRFADFLYWEPQHINRQKRQQGDMQAYERSMHKLRTLEVPLNLLFNVLLRLSPQRTKQRILHSFVPETETQFGQQIEYISIYDRLPEDNICFIQPDAVVESELAHICIELKIDASLTVNQAYKYLALLGLWATKSKTKKKPYLFFLTKKNLAAQWKYNERGTIFDGSDGLTSLRGYLESVDPPHKFNWTAASLNLSELISQVRADVQVGWATWQTIGDVLEAELSLVKLEDSTDGEEILKTLFGDFLSELKNRKLWQPIGEGKGNARQKG